MERAQETGAAARETEWHGAGNAGSAQKIGSAARETGARRRRMMRSMRPTLYVVLLVTALASAAPAQSTPRVERDIPYAQPRNERHLLDIYSPPAGSNHPVVVWIHGGGWMRGSKDEMHHKPAAFVEKGFVFVPVNYRFIPHVKMGEIIRDTAKAAGWVRANISSYGGDPARLFIMGHSAGAQLAALLCTDSRYLEAEGVPRSSLLGCVPVDGDTYDVPLEVATAVARRKREKQPLPRMGHPEKFGELALQREYSAVNHIAFGKGIPPFLIVHVADHTDTSAQAWRLWDALDRARVPARIFGGEETDHVKQDRDIGLPGDAATKALFEFTDHALRSARR
jgi:acetyl esterase/lipase